MEGDGCVNSGCLTIKSDHYSWISSSPIGTVRKYILPYGGVFSIHTTLFRPYSIQKSIGKIKQTCLFTDNLIVDPTYHKNHLAGKVSKWCFLVQYSGVTVTKKQTLHSSISLEFAIQE